MYNKNRCQRISNSYYNLGLEKARARNLSGAIPCLRYALQLNKHNTSARNLLGLIYYEIGEVAEALVQWVISINLQSEENDARRYLSLLRKKPGQLDINEQAIIKFNQALSYATSGNEDLAQLTLTRIVEEKPGYIKAQLLLSLLYMKNLEYQRANKSLLTILEIDKNNSLALHYMYLVKEQTGRAERERKKMADAFSHKKMQDDDVILPSTYKEYTGWQTVLNIGIGLIIGASSMLFLYLPTRTAQLNNKHNSELVAISEKLSGINNQNTLLEERNEDLQEQVNSLNEQVGSGDEIKKQQLIQYQKLFGIVQALEQKNMTLAAQLFSDLDITQIQDIPESGISIVSVLEEVSEKIRKEGYAPLVHLGDTSMAAGDYAAAISYFDMALRIKPDLVEALYKKAVAFKTSGDEGSANGIYQEIISTYPQSEYAEKSKEDRGF